MTQFLNLKEIKEQASIVDLLSRLGFQPRRKSGKEQIYLSMLRESDSTPSFAVNDELGMWFDHGTGKGGNIIDFGLAYWKNLSFGEVIEKLRDSTTIQPAGTNHRPRKAVKIPHYIVESIRDLGTHPAITDYLKSRGIFEIGTASMKEVYYYVQDQKGQRKQFFAAGWKNENGSWEVRNKYFKGCLEHKGMTFVLDHPKKLAVFEGYMNYLSWKLENPDSNHSVLVINTLSLLALAIERAKAFSLIDLFMDRDNPGHAASKDFIKALPYATDKSVFYEGFNDYNDKIVAALQAAAPKAGEQQRRSSYSH